MTHEKVSKRAADLLGSILKSFEISFATGPSIIIATVLLAVAESVNRVRRAIETSADFCPFANPLIF